MKFKFKILNYDAESEMLHVRYTPISSEFEPIRLRLSVQQDEHNNWPPRESILRMIRRSAPLDQWRRIARVRDQTSEEMRPISDLIGHEEMDVSIPEKSLIQPPAGFPWGGVI